MAALHQLKTGGGKSSDRSGISWAIAGAWDTGLAREWRAVATMASALRLLARAARVAGVWRSAKVRPTRDARILLAALRLKVCRMCWVAVGQDRAKQGRMVAGWLLPRLWAQGGAHSRCRQAARVKARISSLYLRDPMRPPKAAKRVVEKTGSLLATLVETPS